MAPARKIVKRKTRGPKRVTRAPPRPEPTQAECINAALPRPTRYTEALGERICERLANGESATAICRDTTMPVWSTLKRWERDHPEFGRRYETARRQGCEYRTDEIAEIADNGTNDYVQRLRKDGTPYTAFDRESFERSRLRMQARQWEAAKILRHVYGERAEVDVRTPDGVNVKVEERNALIDAIVKLVQPKADPDTKPNNRRDEPRER